jgi:hypothetical protein
MQLQPVLRQLNIKFDSVFANQIMTEFPGAAARLLQQLKVKLDMGIGKQHLSTTAGVRDALLLVCFCNILGRCIAMLPLLLYRPTAVSLVPHTPTWKKLCSRGRFVKRPRIAARLT